MYGTDHSTIVSEQQKTTNCTVHIIMYRYSWIIYPVYSKYNSGVFQVRCGVEFYIIGTVKIIVTVLDSIVHYNETQPAKATAYGHSPHMRNEYGTTW
jgi:hypothetical protein